MPAPSKFASEPAPPNNNPPNTVSIAGYTIDAAVSEEHTLEAEVTEFPVEQGAAVTDHVRIKPRVIRIEGIITDTPIYTVGRSWPSLDTSDSRNARQVFDDLFTNKTLVTVVTSVKTYTSMVIQTLDMPEKSDTGEALRFTMTLKQITLVRNVRVTVAVPHVSATQARGNALGKPPGWIGTDKNGRDIVASPAGPGVAPTYTRADGTAVSADEASAASRRNDAALVQYDANGNAVPVANTDYQPYTPRQKAPYWNPPKALPGLGG